MHSRTLISDTKRVFGNVNFFLNTCCAEGFHQKPHRYFTYCKPLTAELPIVPRNAHSRHFTRVRNEHLEVYTRISIIYVYIQGDTKASSFFTQTLSGWKLRLFAKPLLVFHIASPSNAMTTFAHANTYFFRMSFSKRNIFSYTFSTLCFPFWTWETSLWCSCNCISFHRPRIA